MRARRLCAISFAISLMLPLLIRFSFHEHMRYSLRSPSSPENFTEADLLEMPIPGLENRYWDCTAITTQQCWLSVVNECEDQLKLWRIAEKKKDSAKLFTIFYVIIGTFIVTFISNDTYMLLTGSHVQELDCLALLVVQ